MKTLLSYQTLKIERNKTALLVVDMQKHFLAKDEFDVRFVGNGGMGPLGAIL